MYKNSERVVTLKKSHYKQHLMLLLFIVIFYGMHYQVESELTPQPQSNNKVFGMTDFFYTKHCYIGEIIGEDEHEKTIECIADYEQTAIIKADIVTPEISKPPNAFVNFKVELIYSIPNEHSFTIKINSKTPESIMYGFMIVVLKNTQMMTPIVEYVSVSFSEDDLDIFESEEKIMEKEFLSQNNDYTMNINSLEVYFFPMMSYYAIEENDADDVETDSAETSIEFDAEKSYFGSGSKITAKLSVSSFWNVSEFGGIVVIIDFRQVVEEDIDFDQNKFIMGQYSSWDFTTNSPDFGPPFAGKCLIGISSIDYRESSNYTFRLTSQTGNGYEFLDETSDLSNNFAVKFNYFCLGKGKICNVLNPYFDKLADTCHEEGQCPVEYDTSEASAPPTTELNLEEPYTCTPCVQPLCETCEIDNRSICNKCYLNSGSKIVGNECVCDEWHDPLKHDTYTINFGFYNNMIYICVCKPEYLSNSTNNTGTNSQLCNSCIEFDAECKECREENFCTECIDENHFLNTGVAGQQLCEPCVSYMAKCEKCTTHNVCEVCQNGSTFDTSVNKCLCDDGFYENSGKCDSCTENHEECSLCSDKETCMSCTSVEYTIYTVSVKVTCEQCSNLLSECKECTSPTVCTKCERGYGLYQNEYSSIIECELCSTINSNYCLECESSVNCSKCISEDKGIEIVLVNEECKLCSDEKNACEKCYVEPGTPFVRCTECLTGYFLNIEGKGLENCKSCSNIIERCVECQSITQCTKCEYPYTPGTGPGGAKCDECLPEFNKNAKGMCEFSPGCTNTVIDPISGNTICISCDSDSLYEYSSIKKKCICFDGYVEIVSNATGFKTCVEFGGDGKVIGIEQCDDGNMIEGDGCSSEQKVEDGYVCSKKNGLKNPSVCSLKIDLSEVRLNYVMRVENENKGKFAFHIGPDSSYVLSKLDWREIIEFNFSASAADKAQFSYSYDFSTQQVFVTVPYKKDLENLMTQTVFNLSASDKIILTNPDRSSFHTLNFQTIGINSPLIIEDEAILQTVEVVGIASIIISLLVLLQLVIGSYLSKMIGLETVHILQVFYFCRLLVKQRNITVLNSLNTLKNANGYNNLFESQSDSAILDKYTSAMDAGFIQIGLERTFLFNVNITMFLALMVTLIYLAFSTKKFHYRRALISTNKPLYQDLYTLLKRKCSWIYDHFLFPYAICLQYLLFFSTVLYLQSEEVSEKSVISSYSTQSLLLFEKVSFSFNFLFLVVTLSIYCYELFDGLSQYKIYLNGPSKRQTVIESIDHDLNNTDRANYHPLYVVVYLLYYFLIQILMAAVISFGSNEDFMTAYSIEILLGMAVVYLITITMWRPYETLVKWHNYGIIFYQITVVLFLTICMLFNRFSESLNSGILIFFVYLSIFMLGLVAFVGYVRLYIEKIYRALLENNLLNPQKPNPKEEESKRNALLSMNNQYLFENQLIEMKREYIKKIIEKEANDDSHNLESIVDRNTITLTQVEKEYFIKLIQEQNYQKNVLENQRKLEKLYVNVNN